jgi:hypothetical protein
MTCKLLLRPDELRRIIDAYGWWTHIYRAVDQSGVHFKPTPGDPPILQRDVIFYPYLAACAQRAGVA